MHQFHQPEKQTAVTVWNKSDAKKIIVQKILENLIIFFFFLWYGKTRVTSYELQFESLKARIGSLKAQVEIRKCEFESSSYKFESKS